MKGHSGGDKREKRMAFTFATQIEPLTFFELHITTADKAARLSNFKCVYWLELTQMVTFGAINCE